ncbi:MAG: polC [Candidatus Saccharibacteria bacterium]|nr:polC [Candidatus Saccharibacteria bacterium]
MSILRVGTFQAPLVFVDIETNGLSHIRGRVIEVAAIRVEGGVITKSFRSLVDPSTELPQYISQLTGINSGDLRGAPTFDQIADELHEMLEGAIFVAHNVRFDYSFLKQEFSRCDKKFTPKQLCTVKLSRALYPKEKGHKLADLIRRHNFTFAARHRAYDDAAVLWQFIQYICKHFPPEQIEAAITKQIRSPAIPKNIKPEVIKKLPETPGVYIFEDDYGQPLYIGKSINIKKRVMSHFGRDHAESKEFKIAQAIKHVRTQETPGELSALLLESRLIKEMQPVYNRRLRRTQQLLLAKQATSEQGYETVYLQEANQIETDELGDILAVYARRSSAKQALEDITKTYDLCPKLMGLEKSSGACFLYQLKKCRGACIGQETAEIYNQRLQIAFEHQRIHAWPYSGAVLVNETPNHAIIVDQWCIIGEITQEDYCEPVLQPTTKNFDLDTYKILQLFLTTKLNKLKIQVLGTQQLQALLSPPLST